MQLETIDWIIIFAFFALSLIIGLVTMRKAGANAGEFFLSGRNMPWWLLGISMVATTFAADTPNLVTDIVRKDGVSGNWAWWAFLLTGMLTVFVYSRLWRRAGFNTDLEIYEARYSGKAGAFLRGFRALYLGVVFNVIIMATVSLAAIKIGEVMLGLEPWQTLTIASVVTVIYSTLGGLRGVVITDFFQFFIAMIGAIGAAYVVLDIPEVGGLEGLLAHEAVAPKLDFLPDMSNPEHYIPLLVIPLAVQWWSTWYPGAEPGGGGYVAQRMLSAKNERHAMGATLFFNVAHYALRPWPWIIVALVSLVVFPMTILQDGRQNLVITQKSQAFFDAIDHSENIQRLNNNIDYQLAKADADKRANYERLQQVVRENPGSYEVKSLAYIHAQRNYDDKKGVWKALDQQSDAASDEANVYLHIANPTVKMDKLGQDLAYPAMMTYLPAGLIGLVLASLIAAFMSTISTHLNWGSSYVVNDFYKRFVKPDATEKELVRIGRLSTAILMIMAALLAMVLESAKQAFDIIVQIGAGTGLIYILRWFWWRINAYTEISAMIISFFVAIFLELIYPHTGLPKLAGYVKLLIGVGVNTTGWLLVTYLTRPENKQVLQAFYRKVKPAALGWKKVLKSTENPDGPEPEKGQLPLEILGMFIGCILVYAALFFTGFLIYGQVMQAVIAISIVAICTVALLFIWKNLREVKVGTN